MTKADEASTSKKQKDVAMGTFCQASTSKQETKDLEMGIVHGHGDSTDKEEDEWVKYIEDKLKKTNFSRDAGTEINRIHRVPLEFCRNTNEAYKPCIISIGPYHRGNFETKHMEQYKWQCLKDVLDRKKGSYLKKCFQELKLLEVKAKSTYGEDFHLESWDFMEMLLLDGCFIVDHLRQPSRYISDTKSWMKRQIDNDLLLFENQLPFLVLAKTFSLVQEENETRVPGLLERLILNFCRRVSGTGTKLAVSDIRDTRFQHLLDFYHAYLFFNNREKNSTQSTTLVQIPIRTIHSASFLKKTAGIKFRKEKVMDKVIDARFNPDDGVMKITPLVIDAFSSSQFLNLIAFENCNPRFEPRFTEFAKFMHYIIDTSEDVRLLREKGIIEHTLGCDNEVALVFNQLTTRTFECLTPELETVYKEADEFCKKRMNKWNAILMRDYLSSPWAIISIVVGVLILIFGVTQVFMTLLNYIKRKSFGH